MFRIDVIDDPRLFAEMRNEWNELLSSSRSDSIFLTWEWMHTWWKHIGQGRKLFIVALRCGSKLIAVAPLSVHRAPFPTLEFLGTGSVGSDDLDFIIHRTYERPAADSLIEFLRSAGFTLRLPSVNEDSIVASRVRGTLAGRGWRFRQIAMQVCPFIDLKSTSWDSYLESLGASHRYNFRRRLRNLEKSYSVSLERAVSEQECRTALQHVVSLHLKRWSARGGSDGFHERRLLSFHEEFTGLARERGWLRLRLLTLDGKPAGAFYGFRYRDKYSFYQSGFDEALLKQSVGLVTIGLTIQEATEEGAAEYDFLHGDESYKFLWAREVRPLFRVELYPPGVVGRMHRDGVVAMTATKKIVKRALYAPLNR